MSSWPHWMIMPVVLPLLCGALLILLERNRPAWAPWLSIASLLALVGLSTHLLISADSGEIGVYLLSNWRAPFGIVLVLDRLSALMLLLSNLLGLACALHALGGDAQRGAHFHALLQFQLMGLNGAFLTGDLFNLFVFFEVLLIASYGLLLHGGGAARLRAAIHYVSFNLAASALFLIAVGLLYGLTGTLNMADLALRVAALEAEQLLLAKSAALLLLVVFSVKAALLPLYFWLPATYASASSSVAALFAVMTKVGIYAIARVFTLIFGASAGLMAEPAGPWLAILALATLVLGSLGALAAEHLRGQIAYLLVASAGTLLLAIGLGSPGALAAALSYLPGSTLACAALFLLAGQLSAARGSQADALQAAPFAYGRQRLGLLFFIAAIIVGGLPPLSGFIGKALLLQASQTHALMAWVWAGVLLSSLIVLLALARAGSTLFWASDDAQVPCSGPAPGVAAQLSCYALLALAIASGLLAGPLYRYANASAEQLYAPHAYIDAVFAQDSAPARFDVRKEMREAGLSKGGAQ